MPISFDYIQELYRSDILLVKRFGKWWIFNTKGEMLNQDSYDYLFDSYNLPNGFIGVEKEYKIGWLNMAGEIVLPIEYHSIEGVVEKSSYTDMFKVKKNGKKGIVKVTYDPSCYLNPLEIGRKTPKMYILFYPWRIGLGIAAILLLVRMMWNRKKKTAKV